MLVIQGVIIKNIVVLIESESPLMIRTHIIKNANMISKISCL